MIRAPVSKATAPHYTWGGDCDGWHLAASDGLSVIHERMPAGRAEVAHRHARARQIFFVLAGELTMVFGASERRIAAGEALEIDPGSVHQAVNRGPAAVEFLVISQPPTRGDRIEVP